MKIKDVYDQFKHMDEQLTMKKYRSDSDSMMIYTMWKAIKEEVEGSSQY
jgi:hypothetical protein